MAAKLLHSLTDDNPDLHKQIGCMTGIFQIFDRQYMGRRLNGHAPHKRLLPPGNTQFSNASFDADANNAYNQGTTERIGIKHANDKRVPTESPRASLSSSSLAPLDCGRVGHPNPSSLDRISFPENPSRDPVFTQPSASPKLGRLSLDLRDVVKDSMYRESKGLSNQTIMAEEGVGQVSKHRDSPRPLQLPKTFDESLGIGMNGRNDLPGDLKESLKLLAKLREAPWYYSDNEHSRLSYETKNGSLLSISSDAPRYSYDGRDMKNYLSSELRDFSKLNQRIKDLPRLSLDSRERSMRASNCELNLAYLSNNAENGDDRFNEKFSYAQQLSRPPSVVAKLMGLETLPDTKPSRDSQLGPTKTVSLGGHGHFTVSSRTSDVCRPIRHPSSHRSSRKEPNSPRWKHADMRPISSSKCPIEPAPWKHLEGDRSSPKQVVKQLKSAERVSPSSPSVYCEIEKQLKDLEFKKSGKDLRALKQLMEAMQAKEILGTANSEQNSILGTKQEEKQSYKGSKSNSGFISSRSRRNRASASIVEGGSSSKAYEPSIVIMKPAKLVQQSGIPASLLIPIDGLPGLQSQESKTTDHRKYSVNQRVAKNQTPKGSSRDSGASTSSDRIGSNRTLRMGQNSTRTEQVSKDSILSSFKNSGSTSPRLQKKLDLDKRSRPPAPDSDKSNRQLTDSYGSPGGRRRVKSAVVHQTGDQLTERSSEPMNLSGQVDDISVLSGSVSLESKLAAEITSNDNSVETSESRIPTTEALNYSNISKIKTSSSTRLSEDDLVERPPSIAPEHPSPVSVLDASKYRDASPSPVKQTSQYLGGIGTKTLEDDLEEGEWKLVDNLSASDDIGSDFTSKMNGKKLRNIDNLIYKLRQLNTNHDEVGTDYIASLCDNSNPDHRFVSEILLASGLLLRDLGSGLSTFQVHLSGQPINPKLFLVLEQKKLSNLVCKAECNTDDEATKSKLMQEKSHRKLIFDVVNEILARNMASAGSAADPWLKPCKLAQKNLNAQKLLKDLCAEIEQLQGSKKQEYSLEEEQDRLKSILWEDVMHRSDSWIDFHSDVSGVVLDVERSIFKDLVDDILIREASGLLHRKTRRQRRQLFLK